MRAGTPLYTSGARPRNRGRSSSVAWTVAALVALVALLGILIGLAFAGSSRVLAEGTYVAGIDVGGMTTEQAVERLDASFAEVRRDPVTFGAGDDTFAFAANQLGADPDWHGAVAAAARAGDGFGPIRGFRRLHTRFFGAEILPRVAVSDAALEFALDRIASNVDRAPTSAAVVWRGLRIEVRPAEAGRRLARDAAARTLVRTLGSLERPGGVVPLRVATAAPPVTEAMLEPVARRARIALSAPVVLEGTKRRWRLSRQRLAQLLLLPRDGAKRLTISGPRATAYFDALAERVGKPPVDAQFVPSGDGIQVVASRNGTELDVPKTAQALLRAATSRTDRVATVVVARAVPDRTTKEALAMGIDRRLSSYKTWNSGTWDRITNLRLGVLALDDTVVPPGGSFSLNDAIGERTVERGFRPAPVIIGTRYEEEVGGGTSQVATTVFNAAWEAGLNITERNPHSLYIDRYQLGRDATVYWPSLDLEFVNDTKAWVLVKGIVEADGIRVSIYGGEDRRVESSEGTRVVTGSPPVRRVKDPTMPVGTTVIEEYGSSPSRTSVTRTVYDADGAVLREETWNTSYRGEARVVRVGTKQPVAPPKKPKEKAPTGDASAGETTPPATTPPTTQP